MTAVSVIIPIFNRAHSVGPAIDSVLGQVCGDCSIDLIVVDDGSSDDLAAVLSRYGARVKVIRHSRNMGAAAARNTGVRNATGEFVAFLDSDDVWLPGKIQKQLADIRANNWRASCTAFYLRGETGSPRIASGALGLSDLVWGCFVSPGSTLMFERSVFAEVGELDQALGRLEDWDWLLRYTQQHKLGFLAAPLAKIEASSYSNAKVVMLAIDAMRAKHEPALDKTNRRNFLAALDAEAAAARYRAREFVPAVFSLLKSLWRVPTGNRSLLAVLHNKLVGIGPI